MILSCICIVLLVGVDQFIKYWAVHTLQPQGSIPFIKIGGKEVLNLTYLENQGAAFSSFSGMRWFLIAVTVLLMVICAVLMVKCRKRSKMIPICSALIIAGGVGNLIDRLFRGGKVVDYLDVRLFHFAVFNFADCCVVVGVFLLPADKVERTLLAMYVTALIIPYVPIERGLRRCYDRYGRRIDER